MTTSPNAGGRGTAPKVLMLGLDSASPELLEEWMASGDLPVMASLKQRGLSGRTTQPDILGNGAVWSCFHSGLNPGKQPYYDGLRGYDPQTYTFRIYRPGEADVDWFWRQFARAGKRCLLVDMPYTHLEPLPNGGIMILDWGVHNPTTGDRLGTISSPPEIADEVRALVGEDPVGGIQCDWVPRNSLEHMQTFRRQLLDRIEKRTTMFLHYYARGGWDYAQVAFSEPHCGGHYFWHVSDPSYDGYDAVMAGKMGSNPVKDIYTAIDTALGRILESVDDDTTVLLYSSHGMGVQYSATGLLDHILHHLDTGTKAVPPRPKLKHLALNQWRKLPYGWRKPFRPFTRQVGKVVDFDIPRYVGNYAERRFFEVPVNNMSGGIRLNLKGREANGIVDPSEVDALLDWLEKSLRAIRKVESDEPLVSDVIRGTDIYPGPFQEKFPDLFVSYNREKPIKTVASEQIGALYQKYDGGRSGDHVPGGLFLATGPGIQRTVLNAPADAIDFAPTLGALMGVDLGEVDGSPIAGFPIDRT